ncbi:MAG: hypothetical protein HZC48_02085 [Nitrospirae bacterium]|nr:hypothetical protein [Nitrospirota bacterium]
MSIALIMGGALALPIYLIYRFTKHIFIYAPMKLRASSVVEEKAIKITAIIGLILTLLPAYAFSFMVGGQLGGGFGAKLSVSLGFGSRGALLGAFLGLTLFISTVVCIGIVVGALIGKFFGVILSKTIMRKT